MTDQNERPEAAQEEAGSAQGERKAEDLEVDLTAVQGTGKEGRIIPKDVQKKHEQEDSDPQNRAIEQAAQVVWDTFVQLEQGTQADGSLDQNHRNIINQYNVLRAILAGPSETEETPVPNPTQFTPNPDKDFAPNLPLADWKPRKPASRPPPAP